MLVLSRKRDESIVINDNIVITLLDIIGDKVRLGIQAPIEVPVYRSEVQEHVETEIERLAKECSVTLEVAKQAFYRNGYSIDRAKKALQKEPQ